MRDWKTTFVGIIAAILAGVSAVYPEWKPVTDEIGLLIVAILGVAAKDS